MVNAGFLIPLNNLSKSFESNLPLSNSSSSLSFSSESESLLYNLGADLFLSDCADFNNNSTNFCAELTTYKSSDDSEFRLYLSSTSLTASATTQISPVTDGGSSPRLSKYFLNRVDDVLHFALQIV